MYHTPRSSDSDLLPLILLALVAGMFYVFWMAFHTEISYYSLQATWHLLGLFDTPYSPAFIGQWRYEVAVWAANSDQMGFTELLRQANRAGYFYVGIPLLLTGYGLYRVNQHPALKTKRHITADSLREIMAEHSSAIIPVLYYGDLLQADPEAHRSAQTPEEWAAKHNLVRNQRMQLAQCEAALVKELGPRLDSLEDLQLHEQYLLCVFCIRLSEEENPFERSLALLDALNRSCHHGTWKGEKGYPDFSQVDNPFQQYIAREEVKELFRIHPYSRTLLAALHQKAVKLGKLPSAYFRWLKGMDRTLWYVLNSTGRKAPFVESAAVFAQKKWEELAWEHGYVLTEPCVTEAASAIEHYLLQAHIIIKD